MSRSPSPAISETALLFTSPPWASCNDGLLESHTILDPLLGRSLLQRSVEHLVRLGARHLMVILADDSSDVRDFLKSGERWGCRITYHYPDPQASMQKFLKAIGITPHEHYRVGNAWSIVPLAIGADSTQHGAGSALHWQKSGAARWTGWGCLSGVWLLSRSIPTNPAALGACIENDELLEVNLVVPTLIADSPANLICGMERLLNEDDTSPHKCKQAQIHPTARVIAPCYIGKTVKIDARAVIGPHAVIEYGAVVAAGSQVRHSIVWPETYVGEDLELDHVIVRGPLLVNATLASRTEITDPELLSNLHSTTRTSRWAIRAIAAAIQITLSPLHLLLRRSRKFPAQPASHAILPCPSWQGRNMASIRVALALPPNSVTDPHDVYDWSLHFLGTFFPGLGAVRRGELRLFGPSLRSLREVENLPAEWRQIYRESPCGLINDTWLQANPVINSDLAFASDALAAASPEKPLNIFKHLMPYLSRVWHDYRQRGTSPNSSTHPLNTV